MAGRYDAVFFDVGHTLLDYATPNHVGWAEALTELGGPSSEALALALQEVLQGWTTPPGTRESLEEHRTDWSVIYGRVLDAAGFAGNKDLGVDVMWDVWINRVWEPYAEVHEVLSVLRAAGVRLAVVSNWSPTLELTLQGLALAEYFETIVCSALIGCAKPEARIFREAVDRLGVQPARVLHVGDNYEADVLGAVAAGLDAALLVRDPGLEPPGHRPTIGSLTEVLGLLR